MSDGNVTDLDTERARQYWAQYQRQHDVSDRIGETVGIDPVTGRVWFGASAKDIVAQMEVEGVRMSLYFVRIGVDYYLRKGASR